MPHTNNSVVPYVTPETLDRVRSGQFPFGKIHGSMCRCRTCKPPLVGAHRANVQSLHLALLAVGSIVLAIVAAGGR
jgi:hypothetical protein